MRRLLVALGLAAALTAPAAYGAAPPAVRGEGGAVVSGSRLATDVGLSLLAAGGNAVDGAVGTVLALAVVFPEAGNLGGGGFAVVKMGGEVASLDFREAAPAAATAAMYLDAAGEPIPEASLVGPLAAGVPGSPAGLYELHRRYGALPWQEVVEPARRLAAEGFAVDRHLHDLLDEDRERLGRFSETAAVWLPGGEPPPVGSRLVLPDLAATLAAYAEKGPEAITAGPVAAAVAAASRRHGGVLTAADLAAYRPVWRPPLLFSAFGWQLAGMDLPSSGGLILAETTGLLERLGWAGEPRFGADRVHLLTEAFRRAFADRFDLGDPASTHARAEDLLAPAWLDRRAAEIDRDSATPSTEVHPWPGQAPAEETQTTHLSVVDGAGNLVALTTTLNDLFGCRLWVPGAGFFLNNEMDDFATAPGRPNLYGLVQGEANAVAPGRRMLSSMSPTIAWRGGEALALGGRGGSKIPTNVLEVLLDVIVDGDELQQALDRPRIHHQWLPDRLEAEPDALAPETRAELERRGHRVEITAATAKVQAVARFADGSVAAAAEPRGQGAAGVVTPDAGMLPPPGQPTVPAAPVPSPPQP
jgi:gamma-glutamyltranspeptidase / glutathione hydrolase